MEDLYFNLAKEEFSKGRKILIWVFASLITIAGAWGLFLQIFKNTEYTNLGIPVVLLCVGAFLYFIAILATVKRKTHYFKVDNDTIAYRYGLIFSTARSYNWEDVKTIYFPPHTKKATIVMHNGNIVNIDLTWIEKNKSRSIRKHLYYTGHKKSKEIFKKHKKK